MPGKFIRLDSQFSLVSAFWTPEAEEYVQTGFLVSSEDGIDFTTSPSYATDDASASFAKLAHAINCSTVERLPVMIGFTEDGPYTLCQLTKIESPGLHQVVTGESVESTKYRVSVCVSGTHIRGLEDECLKSARYTFTSLHDWLPKASTESWENDHIVLKIPHSEKTIVDASISKSRIRVCLKVFSELNSNEEDGARSMRSIPYVEIETPTPKSLAWYIETGNRLENLLSLLIGRSLALETLFIYPEEGDSGRVVFKRARHVEAFSYFDCVRCSASELANCLTTWLDQTEEFRSVENLALGVLRKGKLFYETEFLSLAQALEGIHRATTVSAAADKATLRKIRRAYKTLLEQEDVDQVLADKLCNAMAYANDPTFASRLEDLCGRLSEPLLTQMGIITKDFVRDVVTTRNYYTHAGTKIGSRKTRLPLVGSSVFYMNQRMSALLRGALLLGLGFAESQISALLIREATRWR